LVGTIRTLCGQKPRDFLFLLGGLDQAKKNPPTEITGSSRRYTGESCPDVRRWPARGTRWLSRRNTVKQNRGKDLLRSRGTSGFGTLEDGGGRRNGVMVPPSRFTFFGDRGRISHKGNSRLLKKKNKTGFWRSTVFWETARIYHYGSRNKNPRNSLGGPEKSSKKIR